MLGVQGVPEGSAVLRVGFVALAVAIAAGFVAGVGRVAGRRAAVRASLGAAGWMAITAGAAAAGLLRFASPPTMPFVALLTVAIAIAVARSHTGERLALELPLAALVGFQSFRVIVELLMHRAYMEGLMPVQMSYSGRNFDIVTGLTAIPVALIVARGRPASRLVLAWNVLGLGLLANILIVALLSAPTPLRVFMNEPANDWISRVPWIWLPTVMVLAAMLGHILIFRRLAASVPARLSISVDIAAAPERVVEVMTDTDRWPEWTRSVKSIKRLDGGPFVVGSRAVIRQPGFPPALWKVTAYQPRNFTWENRAPGVRVVAHHWVDSTATGSRATLSIEYFGLLRAPLAGLTRGITERYLEMEAAGLKQRSENPAFRAS